MAAPRRLLPIALCSLAACGSSGETDDAGSALRAVTRCTPERLGAVLRDRPDASLVVALDCDGDDLPAAIAAAGREQAPFLVEVGVYDEDEPLPDALIDDDRGAAVAVDLALLACGGVPPAVTSYAIGTRAWTAAHRAAGGEPVLAPADAILAMLRTQHATLLTTTPAQGHVTHRVAFLLGADPKPWQVQACDEAKEAAARYPQLEVFEAKGVAAAVRDGAGALLMATIDPRQSLAAGESADGVPMIVLDPLLGAHAACRVGCAPGTLARAVAERVAQLLPEGGGLVACCREDRNPATALRLATIAQALGVDPAALR